MFDAFKVFTLTISANIPRFRGHLENQEGYRINKVTFFGPFMNLYGGFWPWYSNKLPKSCFLLF